MYLLRLGVLVMMLVLGGAALLIGSVTMHSALSMGAITYSATRDGRVETTMVNRSAEPDRFWRLFVMLAVLPVVLGGGAMIFGWRRLRGD